MGNKKYDLLDEMLTPVEQEYYENNAVEVRACLRVAEMIHEIMEVKNLNQSELAEQLEVSPGYVSRLLSGDENPSIRTVAKYLHKLDSVYIQEYGHKFNEFCLVKSSEKSEHKIHASFSCSFILNEDNDDSDNCFPQGHGWSELASLKYGNKQSLMNTK